MITNCALIRSAGQNPDGSMTKETERACEIAMDKYSNNEVVAIYIATGAKSADCLLADEMRGFLLHNGVNPKDIIYDPTAHSEEAEWLRCADWLLKTHSLGIEHMIQVSHDSPGVVATA
ncbi:MAG: hypothetical protein AAB364_01050 [Patescibacteria group bacterium]